MMQCEDCPATSRWLGAENRVQRQSNADCAPVQRQLVVNLLCFFRDLTRRARSRTVKFYAIALIWRAIFTQALGCFT
jgi:hypothetical protein